MCSIKCWITLSWGEFYSLYLNIFYIWWQDCHLFFVLQNTNDRLCIQPLGFQVDDTKLKRAGLDYWPYPWIYAYRILIFFPHLHLSNTRPTLLPYSVVCNCLSLFIMNAWLWILSLLKLCFWWGEVCCFSSITYLVVLTDLIFDLSKMKIKTAMKLA